MSMILTYINLIDSRGGMSTEDLLIRPTVSRLRSSRAFVRHGASTSRSPKSRHSSTRASSTAMSSTPAAGRRPSRSTSPSAGSPLSAWTCRPRPSSWPGRRRPSAAYTTRVSRSPTSATSAATTADLAPSSTRRCSTRCRWSCATGISARSCVRPHRGVLLRPGLRCRNDASQRARASRDR